MRAHCVEFHDLPIVTLDRHENLYLLGERGDNLFIVESGWIKRVMYTRCGKTSLLDFHGRDEVVGESCLAGDIRFDSAVAKVPTVARVVRREQFLEMVRATALMRAWVASMSTRLREQEEAIAQFVTMNSEQRLAQRLLVLGRKIGYRDGSHLVIPYRLTHSELAEMVGTTRSRIGHFLKRFETAELIQRDGMRLVIDEVRLDRDVTAR